MIKTNSLLLALVVSTSLAIAGGSSSVGTGNPASINCLELGGVLESSGSHEKSFCVIEQWRLFTQMNDRGLVKPHDYTSNGPIGMPNPASVNCNDITGKLRVVTDEFGKSGHCVVEVWTLWKIFNSND